MYNLSITFSSAKELLDFVSKMPEVAGAVIDTKPEANIKPKKEKEDKKEEDKKEEKKLDEKLAPDPQVRVAALRVKLTSINEKGESYMKKNRALLDRLGARSISTLDPSKYDELEKGMDEIAAS